MKTFKQYLTEAKTNPIVMAFGRFNPPSIGHQKLVNRVQMVARSYNADWRIYVSHSHDPKKNPLPPKRKVFWLHKMFPSYRKNILVDSKVKTFIDMAKAADSKYDRLIMVAGDDRVKEYERILNTYNGRDFNYDDIQVVSAGKRDPNASGVTGMSASKLRKAVQEGDFESFSYGVPLDGKQTEELYNELRKEMGLQ